MYITVDFEHIVEHLSNADLRHVVLTAQRALDTRENCAKELPLNIRELVKDRRYLDAIKQIRAELDCPLNFAKYLADILQEDVERETA